MWINAQNTTNRRYGGLTEDGRNLDSPTDGDDWILHLKRSAQ